MTTHTENTARLPGVTELPQLQDVPLCILKTALKRLQPRINRVDTPPGSRQSLQRIAERQAPIRKLRHGEQTTKSKTKMVKGMLNEIDDHSAHIQQIKLSGKYKGDLNIYNSKIPNKYTNTPVYTLSAVKNI